MQRAKTLIRLGGFESELSTQVVVLVLLCGNRHHNDNIFTSLNWHSSLLCLLLLNVHALPAECIKKQATY